MSKLLQSFILVALAVGAFIYHRAKQTTKTKNPNAEKINTMDKTVKKDEIEAPKQITPEENIAAQVPHVGESVTPQVESVKKETEPATGTAATPQEPEIIPVPVEPKPETKTPEETSAEAKAKAEEESKLMAEEEARVKAEEEAREKAKKEAYAKAIEEAQEAAGKARKTEFDQFSYERKMEDVQDYSALMKPQLLKKYNEIEFNNLVKQSALLLKDEAKYERENGKASAEKVKKFIDDVIVGEKIR